VCKCPDSFARTLANALADARYAHSNYVSQDEARSLGLATVNGNSFILRADHTTTLSPGGKGRDSFRIISNNKYGTHVSV